MNSSKRGVDLQVFQALILFFRKCMDLKSTPRITWIRCKKASDCPPGHWCPMGFCAPLPWGK